MSDRERGTMVRRLDNRVLAERALAHLKVIAPEVDWVEAMPVMSFATKEVEYEGRFVICTEGVGWKVGYGEPFVLEVSTKWRDEKGEVHGTFGPSAEVYLHGAEVVAAEDLTDEGEVDLADFIRSFGSRLESNFYLWHNRLNPRPKRTRKAKK